AVLQGDYVWGDAQDIADVPPVLVERLEHYFSTYKLVPGEGQRIRIAGTYGNEHAFAVVEAAMEDYRAHFPLPE
ncbi:MAG: inorganic diphosphatase, partial [Acidobacteriota bacterium]